jgi:type II secretory pathway pseudopilin PulG
MMSKFFKKKSKSFTMVELLLVIMALGILLPTIFSAYRNIQQTKREIDVRQALVQQTYEFFERMNVLIQDYTIDYEEYFNRQRVGCSSAPDFSGTGFIRDINGSGYCSNFTAYGNQNGVGNSFPSSGHALYYRSSYDSQSLAGSKDPYLNPPVCKLHFDCGQYLSGMQSYGQYSKLFYDVKDDVDKNGSMVGDSDDEDVGSGEIAIANATGIQELYLISPDEKNRLYFRRKLIDQKDMNENGTTEGGERLYVIQMLRLR